MLAPWVQLPCTQIVSQTYQWSSQVRRRICPRNSNCVPKPGKLPRNAGHLLGTMHGFRQPSVNPQHLLRADCIISAICRRLACWTRGQWLRACISGAQFPWDSDARNNREAGIAFKCMLAQS